MVTYSAGRTAKGNGVGTEVGYYMDMTTQYLDLVVEITNVYNQCNLDYIMQAFGPWFTSLSGFLGALTSILEVIVDANEVPVYTGISAAVYAGDQANAGLWTGLWFKHAINVELQDTTIQENTFIIGTMSNNGGSV